VLKSCLTVRRPTTPHFMAYKCVQNTNLKIKNNLKRVLKLILTNKQFKKKCSIIYKILILLGDVICFLSLKEFLVCALQKYNQDKSPLGIH